MIISRKNTNKICGMTGAPCACSLLAAIPNQKDKKSKCCKSFKHGKRCKKCPGKKKG